MGKNLKEVIRTILYRNNKEDAVEQILSIPELCIKAERDKEWIKEIESHQEHSIGGRYWCIKKEADNRQGGDTK